MTKTIKWRNKTVLSLNIIINIISYYKFVVKLRLSDVLHSSANINQYKHKPHFEVAQIVQLMIQGHFFAALEISDPPCYKLS